MSELVFFFKSFICLCKMSFSSVFRLLDCSNRWSFDSSANNVTSGHTVSERLLGNTLADITVISRHSVPKG